MITSQHIILCLVCIAVLHYIFEPRDVGMKGLLYLKQLFDERCRINALTVINIPGWSFLNYLKTLYYQFNSVNVTACQPLDLSIPGKPSASVIASMSHLYMKNSTTKYFTKSPLVNELRIESILIKHQLNDMSALVSKDQLWIYALLAVFIIYPFLQDRTVSYFQSIEDSLFDSGSTGSNNLVLIRESATEANNAPEQPPVPAQPSASEQPPAPTRHSPAESSGGSSTGTILLDCRDAAEDYMTASAFLEEEVKAAGPLKDRNAIPFEPTKSQRFWSFDSSSLVSSDSSDPFGFPIPVDSFGMSSDSSNSGDGFQFPKAPGGASTGHTTTAAPTAAAAPTTLSNPPTVAGPSKAPEPAPYNGPPERAKPGPNAVPTTIMSWLLSSGNSRLTYDPATRVYYSEKLSTPGVVGPSKVTAKPADSQPKPFGASTAPKPAKTASPPKPATKSTKMMDSSLFDGHITPPEHPNFA